MQQRHPMLSHAFGLAQAGREAEAMAIIERLAGEGEPEALFTLADVHWRGGPVKQDFARGRILFGKASDAGHPMALAAIDGALGLAFRYAWRRTPA